LENVYIGTRIEIELKETLEKVCRLRGEDLSDFLRRAILKELAQLSFLPPDQKKALGVTTNE